jgi:triosephosphate isomerase
MNRKLIAGNWKMNGLLESGRALARDLAARVGSGNGSGCDYLVCPPAHLLLPVGEAIAGSAVALGAQDCHTAEKGAHTGDISAAMLADAGCRHVILGHSERRSDHGESDALVRRKAEAARGAGLMPIVCVGESESQRLAGQALEVISGQIEGSLPEGAGALVVAYEPVWAIGTGRSATPQDVAEVHAHIRGLLRARLGDEAGGAVRILYGGSVKASNAAELLAVPDVDGALVGGASLKAEEFHAIGAACP